MVEVVRGDKGGWAASDGDKWLVNADSKGPTRGPNSKKSQQEVGANNKPNFKRSR
jgi:hypothetical protein